jgi:hypothetical protein
MKRLGYVKLLYRQAVTQSYAPPPLNFSSVLAQHDVLEYFFIVAVSHLGNPDGLNLKDPFLANVTKLRAPDGGQLSSLDGVRRISTVRNGFKHEGLIPGPDQVEDARRDATNFLEGNCRRLFGMEFDEISMLHIVPQEAVRDHLTSGRAAADGGDLDAAMAGAALAFDQLITGWGRVKYVPGSSFEREPFPLQGNRLSPRRRIEAFPSPSDDGVRRAVDSLASSVTKALEDLDKELESLRQVLRVQMAGIDMTSYARFMMLTPKVVVSSGGHRDALHGAGQLHYTPENYNFCENFVVDSALLIDQRDFRLWMPETYGDWTRAQAARAANGGRLPQDFR